MVTPLVLALHLLAPDPLQLQLLPSSLAPRAGLSLLPSVSAAEVSAGLAVVPGPSRARRAGIVAAQMGVGAGVILANDALLAVTDYTLVIGGAAVVFLSGSNAVLYGVAGGILLLNLFDLLALPVLMATAENGVSQALGGLSSRVWAGALGGGALELLLDGIGVALAVNQINATSGISLSALLGPLSIIEALRLVGMPLATSVGLFLGEGSPTAAGVARETGTVSEPSPGPASLAPEAPGSGTPGPRTNTLFIPLFAAHFG